MEPCKDIRPVKAFLKMEVSRICFLMMGTEVSSIPRLGRWGKKAKPKAVSTKAGESCQENLEWTRCVGGWSKPCYYASVKIIYVALFRMYFLCSLRYLPLKLLLLTFQVSVLISGRLHAAFNFSIKGVSQQSLKAKKRGIRRGNQKPLWLIKLN